MTSAGAMGGGVSSAIARALGAGDVAAARRLVVHALVIASAMGVAFTLLILFFGIKMYGLLGGRGEILQHALAYSNTLFAGAIVVWIANTLSSVLRGSGNMMLPALALIGAAVVHVPLSAALVLGLGRCPGSASPAPASPTSAPSALPRSSWVHPLRRSSPLRPGAATSGSRPGCSTTS